MMGNLNVFSLKLFFFIKALLKKTRQCIYFFIYIILIIINSKMITKELLIPTDLKKAQTFYIYELLKIIIVGKNENLMFIVF